MLSFLLPACYEIQFFLAICLNAYDDPYTVYSEQSKLRFTCPMNMYIRVLYDQVLSVHI